MATGNFFKYDLARVYNIVQNAAIIHPKEMVIAALKEYFSNSIYYRYVKDEFGFAKTPEQKDLSLDAGIFDNLSTRVFIGENYRFDNVFYPAILVKNTGVRSVPISFNRENGCVQYEFRPFDDGYGNISYYRYPKAFIFAGAWEGTLSVDIKTRSLRSRDDLVEATALAFVDIFYETLKNAGVVIKPGLNIGSASEQEDRNDKLFTQSITLEYRSEWRREIPINNLVETINFIVEFGDKIVAPNLTINTNINFVNTISPYFVINV